MCHAHWDTGVRTVVCVRAGGGGGGSTASTTLARWKRFLPLVPRVPCLVPALGGRAGRGWSGRVGCVQPALPVAASGPPNFLPLCLSSAFLAYRTCSYYSSSYPSLPSVSRTKCCFSCFLWKGPTDARWLSWPALVCPRLAEVGQGSCAPGVCVPAQWQRRHLLRRVHLPHCPSLSAQSLGQGFLSNRISSGCTSRARKLSPGVIPSADLYLPVKGRRNTERPQVGRVGEAQRRMSAR